MSRKHREAEAAFIAKGYAELATFNGEVARGIVHTPEYAARMALLQERFVAEQLAEAKAKGWFVFGAALQDVER